MRVALKPEALGLPLFTEFRKLQNMEHRISATELARRLGDVLGRIRYKGDTFLIERNRSPVARIVPLAEHPTASLREAVAAWRGAGEPDPDFADALDRVAEADRPPESHWAS